MKEKKRVLKFPLKGKYVAMVAPSFVVDFSYPEIISYLKKLGFDKVVEATFGAKMVNREYHSSLKGSFGLKISTACPGIVDLVKRKYPERVKDLVPVDSPMIAMGKICRKVYPGYKIIFISPCNYKKIEAKNSKFIDGVVDFNELKELVKGIKISGKKEYFDKFYNDYTKIYPLAGGLSKTVHLKGILKKKEVKVIDGVGKVTKFLDKPSKEIKFLDCNFCIGGCVGGPCIGSKKSLRLKRKRVLDYLKFSLKEDIPEVKKGLIDRAKGISFRKKF
jgi:iron only hydrogenase large subunit-like protein